MTSVVSEMTYTVSSGTLNSSIPYHTIMTSTIELWTAVEGSGEICCPEVHTDCLRSVEGVISAKER